MVVVAVEEGDLLELRFRFMGFMGLGAITIYMRLVLLNAVQRRIKGRKMNRIGFIERHEKYGGVLSE